MLSAVGVGVGVDAVGAIVGRQCARRSNAAVDVAAAVGFTMTLAGMQRRVLSKSSRLGPPAACCLLVHGATRAHWRRQWSRAVARAAGTSDANLGGGVSVAARVEPPQHIRQQRHALLGRPAEVAGTVARLLLLSRVILAGGASQ